LKKIIIFILILLIAACQTIEEHEGIPYSSVTIQYIEDAIAAGNLIDALWYCELYGNQNKTGQNENIDEKKELIIGRIRQKFQESNQEDPEKLLAIYDSLKNMGIEISDENTDTLYKQLVEEYRQSLETENKHAGDWLDLKNENSNGSSTADNVEKLNWDKIIKSTVTVFLDRGIKIEGGFGFKDLALGSGFFITDDGYIITNYHVIESHVDPKYEGLSRVYIKLEDYQSPRIPVKVVGWDPLFDLALLKAEIDAPETIPLSHTAELKPGDRIYAIGSPGGLEKTLTSGIVSASKRPLLELGKVLQVDVPINHGNSGGPLLNENGQLVGIVFAGAENFEGINFAIPNAYLFNSLYKMAAGGMVEYPFLGFVAIESRKGIEIIYIFPDSAAESAGLQTGDAIIAMNGNSVKTIEDMTDLLYSFRIGSLIKVQTRRENKEADCILKSGIRNTRPLLYAVQNDTIQDILFPVFGMELTLVDRSPFYKKYSVQRVLPGSAAEEQGMSVNDTIKLFKYKYLGEQNALMLDISVRKKTSAFLDIRMQIGAYLYATGIF
jgi:serine protease Do